MNHPLAARIYVGGAIAAACAVMAAMALSGSSLWLLPLTAASLLLANSAYRVYLGRIEEERRKAQRMSELHLATTEALALAIDAKDQTAPNHIRRVQIYATGLARALGMSRDEIHAVKTAALLHDIGKLAVPEHILAKPGPLTAEEFQKVRIHPQVGADIIADESKPSSHLQTGEGARTLGARVEQFRHQASVFQDIAVAHKEIYALYQIAQTMGTSLGVSDTMGLVSSKLIDLVPYSACALFLYTDSTDMLQCRFAVGTDSELIQQLALRSGQGLTGWVARNRRPLVNARPSADMEAMGSKAPTVLESALVCPLIFGERLIGTLAVYHTESGFYQDDHRRLLDRVCEQAAAVNHNS